MSTFGDDLIQAMTEALAHAKGEGPAIVHAPVVPREVREQARLTQAQMAPLMGMSLSGCLLLLSLFHNGQFSESFALR